MDEVRGDFLDIKVRSFGSNENIQREIVVSIGLWIESLFG